MPNKWIQFVKDWASAHNLSYACALSRPEMREEYRKKNPKPLTKKQQKELMKPVVLQESTPQGNVKSLVTVPKAGNTGADYNTFTIKVRPKKKVEKPKPEAGVFDKYSVGQRVAYYWQDKVERVPTSEDVFEFDEPATVLKITPKSITLLFDNPNLKEKVITPERERHIQTLEEAIAKKKRGIIYKRVSEPEDKLIYYTDRYKNMKDREYFANAYISKKIGPNHGGFQLQDSDWIVYYKQPLNLKYIIDHVDETVKDIKTGYPKHQEAFFKKLFTEIENIRQSFGEPDPNDTSYIERLKEWFRKVIKKGKVTSY